MNRCYRSTNSRDGDRRSITVCSAAAVRGWAKSDPNQAKAWVASQPRNAERAAYVGSLFKVMSESDEIPDIADQARWLEGELTTPGIGSVVNPFVHRWVGEDIPAAMAWVNASYKEHGPRKKVLQNIVRSSSEYSDAHFDRLADAIQNMEPGLAQDEVTWALVREVATQASDAARQWAMGNAY